jgi:putative DNA primase/helicase
LGIDHAYLKNKHGVCPVCGGKDRFRFDDKEGRGTFYCNQCGAGDGVKLLRNYHNWNFLETINKVAQILGIQLQNDHVDSKPVVNSFPRPRVQNNSNQDDLKKRRNALIYTWLQTQLLSVDDPVDCYLKSRGIAFTQYPAALRYHPNLPYYDEKKLIGYFPAMLALVRDQNNKGVTLHRTYLGKGCKADVPTPKKLMPSIEPNASVGAAIKLYKPVDGKIVLAEGIETALAIHMATKLPVWSTISAGGLEKIILPPSITEIIIAIDNDESQCGQNVGKKLAARLIAEGRKVKRIMPPSSGQDFNDLLLEDSV